MLRWTALPCRVYSHLTSPTSMFPGYTPDQRDPEQDKVGHGRWINGWMFKVFQWPLNVLQHSVNKCVCVCVRVRERLHYCQSCCHGKVHQHLLTNHTPGLNSAVVSTGSVDSVNQVFSGGTPRCPRCSENISIYKSVLITF